MEWERSRAEFRYIKCLGLELRYTHCCMGIVGTGAGATHMRAVGVEDSEQAAGGTWMWAGARPALAEGAAVCAGWNHTGQRELSPAPGAGALPCRCQADVRPPLARAGASC